MEGLRVGGKGPVAVLNHCRRNSAVLICTQATLALAVTYCVKPIPGRLALFFAVLEDFRGRVGGVYRVW